MPFIADMKSLTIASGQTNGTAIGGFDDAEALVIYAPATLTGTITLQVAPEREASEGGTSTAQSWATMQSGGVDITLPAGKALTLTDIAFRQLRLVSGSAEGGDRAFRVTKQIYQTASVR